VEDPGVGFRTRPRCGRDYSVTDRRAQPNSSFRELR
jgi:hypothetical protein